MTANLDHDLAPLQWQALKALRSAGSELRGTERLALPGLVELGLAALQQGHPLITREGRQVLLRGSPRLWDLAA